MRCHVSTASWPVIQPSRRLRQRGIRPRRNSVAGACSNADTSWATMPVSGRLLKRGPVVRHFAVRSYRPDVSPAYRNSVAVQSVIKAIAAGESPDRGALRDAVRELLRELSVRAPGRSVEVRVPPFGAVQCIPGPRHTRGTPPNVVETDAVTWVKVATGEMSWSPAVESGVIRSSGVRADLSPFLPLSSDS